MAKYIIVMIEINHCPFCGTFESVFCHQRFTFFRLCGKKADIRLNSFNDRFMRLLYGYWIYISTYTYNGMACSNKRKSIEIILRKVSLNSFYKYHYKFSKKFTHCESFEFYNLIFTQCWRISYFYCIDICLIYNVLYFVALND